MFTRILLIAMLLIAVACNKGTPTSPSPSTPPPASPTPPALTFTPDTESPSGRAMAILVASRGHEPGKITLAVTAHNLSNVSSVRGEIWWDQTLLVYDNWGQGEWFAQGGAIVDWTFFTNTPGIQLYLDRPTTLPTAAGSGEVFLFRLRPRDGVRSGTTQIQWSEPRIYDQGFRTVLLNNVYGGTVIIQ